jgi:hypothetical protein
MKLGNVIWLNKVGNLFWCVKEKKWETNTVFMFLFLSLAKIIESDRPTLQL